MDLILNPVKLINGIRSEFYKLTNYRAIFNENEKLTNQNGELLKKIVEYKELELQNKRLKKFFHLRSDSKIDFVVSNVIAFDSSNLSSSVIIDKGKKSGVTPGMAVITDLGLVGRISESAMFSSKVLLIQDPDVFVSARLQRSRELGLVSSRFLGLKMQYLPLEADVQKQDIVITAGIKVGKVKSIYPEGVPIGIVTDVIQESNMQTKTAFIKPFVNLNKLEEVLVIK